MKLSLFVIILTSLVFYVSSNFAQLKNTSGTVVTSKSGTFLVLQGNYNNSGTFTSASGSTVKFTGGSTQTITNTGSGAFANLIVNKSANSVTLNSNVTINGTLTQTNGTINQNGNTLSYGNGGGGITWTETTPTGSSENKNWSPSAMNSDGTKLIAGVAAGRLYTSTDGGTNWAETQPAGDANKAWAKLSMSSDGTIIIAGVYPGRIYVSTNSGSSWTETQPAGDSDQNWTTTSMSSDGSTIIAGVNGGRLYVSTNTGGAWSETQPAGNVNGNWRTSAMSSDGTKILAGGYPSRLYISTNSGSSWTETTPGGSVSYYWYPASMSSDGATIIAGVYNGRIYVSTNTGTSWTETTPTGTAENKPWRTTAMSSDGTRIAAGAAIDRLYNSTNTGSSWTETQPAGDANQNWLISSMNSDASKQLVGVYGGKLYMTSNPLLLPVELISFTSELSDGKILLKWQTATEVNNYGFEVERQRSENGTQNSEWKLLGFVPGYGNSNSPKDYMFLDEEPFTDLQTGDTISYRLKQIDTDGSYTYYEDTIDVDASIITSLLEEMLLPKEFALKQNYPNPFNPSTTIKYDLPKDQNVRLDIYNILGVKVKTLINENKRAGRYSVVWNGKNDHGYKIASGMYIYSIKTREFNKSVKMLMIK